MPAIALHWSPFKDDSHETVPEPSVALGSVTLCNTVGLAPVSMVCSPEIVPGEVVTTVTHTVLE